MSESESERDGGSIPYSATKAAGDDDERASHTRGRERQNAGMADDEPELRRCSLTFSGK